MEKTIQVLDRLVEQGVIRKYAIAGAHAALYYIEPTLTRDLDILISVDALAQSTSGLLTLEPILSALRKAGYTRFEHEGIVIDDWPVQFLPVSDDLDAEALDQAVEVNVQVPGEHEVKTRILRAEHLVAIAVKVGRPKDWGRVHDFLAQGAVNLDALKTVLQRHSLIPKWRSFCEKSGVKNPFA